VPSFRTPRYRGGSGQEMIREYLQVTSGWIPAATEVPNPFIQQ
jgi:hypothetical protein